MKTRPRSVSMDVSLRRTRVRYSGIPSQPQPQLGLILVTGATGYIGGRLIDALRQRGYQIRAMVRCIDEGLRQRWPDVDFVEADAGDFDAMKRSLNGVSVAYYLLHSRRAKGSTAADGECQHANIFREAAGETGVVRIIYLAPWSAATPGDPHQRSCPTRILCAAKAEVTVLRSTTRLPGSCSRSCCAACT